MVYRYALIGGAPPSFMGPVHATSASMDRKAVLVAGAFSSNPEKSKAAGILYNVDPSRSYSDWKDLLEGESKLPEDIRAQFIIIATPNDTHYPICVEAIERGFHIVCDKPLSISLEEGLKLKALLMKGEKKSLIAVTHSYTGYASIRWARELVQSGKIGKLLAVRATYLQDGAFSVRSSTSWKSDISRYGAAYCVADIGIHAYNLLRYVTGEKVTKLSASLTKADESRPLDDYAAVTLKFEKTGVIGQVTASKLSHGHLNNLTLEVDCSEGSLSWCQEDPDKVYYRKKGHPTQIYTAGASYNSHIETRLPAAHPEGYLEALANIYKSFYADLDKIVEGKDVAFVPEATSTLYPNLNDGVEGMAFIEASVASSKADGEWVKLEY